MSSTWDLQQNIKKCPVHFAITDHMMPSMETATLPGGKSLIHHLSHRLTFAEYKAAVMGAMLHEVAVRQ